MAPVFRRVAAVLGVATFLVGMALPPVHVHLGEDADVHDHAEGLVHSHWAAHDGFDPDVDIRDGHGHVLFLDQSATASRPTILPVRTSVARVVADPATVPLVAPVQASAEAAVATRDGPRHRLSPLRAPPASA